MVSISALWNNMYFIFAVHRVGQNSERPWAEVYDFIFDRLRAVRQDMTIQQMDGPEAIILLEYAVRFYIYAEYRYNHGSRDLKLQNLIGCILFHLSVKKEEEFELLGSIRICCLVIRVCWSQVKVIRCNKMWEILTDRTRLGFEPGSPLNL